MSHLLFVLCASLLLSVGFGSISLATLGESEDSVLTVQRAFHSFKSVEQKNHFRVHQLDAPSTLPQRSLASTVGIKEYVADSGTVFSVTWNGPSRPDLSLLFGKYYDEYEKAFAAKPKMDRFRMGRRLELTESTNLVVKGGGKEPLFWGRAYVKSLVPAGVDPEELP